MNQAARTPTYELAPYHVYEIALPEGVDPRSVLDECREHNPVQVGYYRIGSGHVDEPVLGGVTITLAPEATVAERAAVVEAFDGRSRDIIYRLSTYLPGTITKNGLPVDGQTGPHA